MVRDYLCNNRNISVWLQQYCATGLMDMLQWHTRPDWVAKQVVWNGTNVYNKKQCYYKDYA